MKVVVQEVDGEGLESFMGKSITIFCGIYIYTGKLVGVNERCVKLAEAKVVYETGSFSDKGWKDAQSLPGEWYIQIGSIESFGHIR